MGVASRLSFGPTVFVLNWCQRLRYASHAGSILKYGTNNLHCKRSCYYASFIKPSVTYFRRPSVRCAISRFCGHSTNLWWSCTSGGFKHTSQPITARLHQAKHNLSSVPTHPSSIPLWRVELEAQKEIAYLLQE